jgi:hypothetical protein
MRRLERHDPGLPDRPGINPFTKRPITIKGRPSRTVRCDLDVDGTNVRVSWAWFEGGVRTAGPNGETHRLADPDAANAFAAEYAEDLRTDGFSEDGREVVLAISCEGRDAHSDHSFPATAADLSKTIVDHCRQRSWFGSDMGRRCAEAGAAERRQFRHGPATNAEIAETERQLGFALPPLLRALYSQVANGGFGPGYGLVGAVGGAPAEDASKDIAECYRQDRDLSLWQKENGFERDNGLAPFLDEWPGRVLRLVHWGCAIWSCLDVRSGRVLRYEPLHGKRTREAMIIEATSLESWIERWLQADDRVHPPRPHQHVERANEQR